MNTIYWLSLFGTILGFGLLLLNISLVVLVQKYGSYTEKFAVQLAGGVLGLINWWFPLFGTISLITFLTVGK
jgi:hypothetical protein